MKLDPEQQRILTLRARYAQIGINYDKATRHFLERHGEKQDEEPVVDDSRSTLKLLPVAMDRLAKESMSAE